MSATIPDAPDYTVDPGKAASGQLIWYAGYEPALLLNVEDDGNLEVLRFANPEFLPFSDFSTVRGPRPSAFEPATESPGDRVAALESQVASLLALLKTPGVTEAIQTQLGADPTATPAPASEGAAAEETATATTPPASFPFASSTPAPSEPAA